jgi:hypothetical protein
MPIGIIADKLLDLCHRSAGEIAEHWYKTVSVNPRTPAFHILPKELLVHQAVTFYKNMKAMYFAKSAYDEVALFLENSQYSEDMYTKGVPLSEIIYALTMMRRHIWLYAETQALFFDTPQDIFQQSESINRVVLVFDYIIFLVVQKYENKRLH